MQVFGKLAKGAAALGAAENESPLEQLMHRVREASALSEKRTALHDIKELLQDHSEAKAAFGSLGGISLMVELLTEREDLEIVHAALETLLTSLSEDGQQGSAVSATNCELFVQSLDHLAVLLSLLEPQPTGVPDFYVCYYAVQILNSCLKTGRYKLQVSLEAVCRTGGRLGSLLRLLSEREAIRNEVLLILIQITTDHPSLQEAAVKGGIFGKLFGIARAEGGAEGGIVVHDCLDLMTRLLGGNEATQRTFREEQMMGELLKFLELVDVRVLGAEALMQANQDVSQQKLDNIRQALKLTELLVCGVKPAVQANCVRMNEADCLPVLSQLCLNEGGVEDVAIRILSLRCMGRVLLLAPDSKKLLVKLRVFLNAQPTEALMALLGTALRAPDRDEAQMALSAIDSFFDSNREAQERVLASLVPMPGQSPTNSAFISDVIESIEACRDGSETGSRAVQVLGSVVKGNPTVQTALVTHAVPLPRGQDPSPLLTWLMGLLGESLQFGSDPEISRAQCLCVLRCLDGCPLAVEAVLKIESSITLLVAHLQKSMEEIPNQPRGPLSVSSCIAVILATCLGTVLESPDHPNSQAMAEYLKDVVSSSVGGDNFVFLLTALYDRATESMDSPFLERLSHFLPLLQTHYPPSSAPDRVPQRRASMDRGVQADVLQEEADEKLPDVQMELERTRMELQSVRAELQSVKLYQQEEPPNDALHSRLSQQDRTIQELHHQVAHLEKQGEHSIDSKERDEMLVCLGIEHAKVQILSAKLFELGYDPDALLTAEMDKLL